MNLDFQLNLQALERAVVQTVSQQIVAQRVCIPGIFQYPFDGLINPGSPAVLDHLTVDSAQIVQTSPRNEPPFQVSPADVTVHLPSADPATPASRTVQASPIAVAVVATLWLARQSDLEAANASPVAPDRLRAQRVQLVYFMSVTVAGGQASLGFQFQELRFGLGSTSFVDADEVVRAAHLDPALLMGLASRLDSIPPTPLDVSAIRQLLDASYGLWNAGLSVTAGVLTVRLQIDKLDLSPLAATPFLGGVQDGWTRSWSDFYSLGARDRLGADQWGLFVDAEVFQRGAEGQVRSGLAGRTDVVLLDNDPPRAGWTVEGGNAVVRTHFGLNVPGACKPWGADIQANVDLRLMITGRTGVLRLDLNVGFSPYAGEVFLCALGNLFIGGFVGLVIGGVIANWPGAIVGAIIGGLIGFIGTFVAAYTYSLPAGTRFGPFQPVMGSSSDFFDEVPIAFPSTPGFGALTMTGVIPFADGIVLGGTLGGVTSSSAELVVGPLPAGFGWQAPHGCADPQIDAMATITGTSRGGTPLYFCEPQILSSNAALYTSAGSSLTWPSSGLVTWGWSVSEAVTPEAVTAIQAATGSAPAEPFKLLLQSNGGARILSFPGVDASLTEQGRANTAAALALSCAYRVNHSGSRRFPPGGQGDPFRDRPGDVEWNILARAVDKGTAIVVRNERGETLAHKEAGPAGEVSVRLWISEKERGNALDVTFEPAQGAPIASPKIAMPILKAGLPGVGLKVVGDAGTMVIAARALYARTATLAVQGKLLRHAFGRMDGAPVLALATEGGASVYSLAHPGAPWRLYQRVERGLAGASPLGKQGDVLSRRSGSRLALLDLAQLVPLKSLGQADAGASPAGPVLAGSPARAIRQAELAAVVSPEGDHVDVLTLVEAQTF